MNKHLITLAIPLCLTLTQPAGAVTSAELYRSTPDTFGKFEARIQFAAGDGVISSYFLWKFDSEMDNVFWNELDFEKMGANCDLQTNSIYGLPQSNHEKSHTGLTGLCQGYHTYSYEWTPDYIAWFVDGTEIRRDTGADATAYAENASEGMQTRFNLWPGDASFGGNFSEASLPVYQYISWAQYSAYTPDAGDGGSDFTLSWREEFDSAPSGWEMGTWDSPLGLSTHSAQNVVFVDGIAVLALTSDDATGYTGSPPADDSTASGGADAGGGTGGADGTASGGADGTASGGAASSGGSAAASGGSAAASGGAAAGSGGSAAYPGSQGKGCTYSALSRARASWQMLLSFMVVALALVRRAWSRTRLVRLD